MAAHVWQKTLLLSKLLTVVFCLCGLATVSSISIPRRDLCVSKFPSHLYVVLGERGLLVAENVSVANTSGVEEPSWSHCTVQLITCSTCVIFLAFRDMDLPQGCPAATVVTDQKTCPCDHVWLSEQDKVPRAYFCSPSAGQDGSDLSYQSQTRYLSITFSYSRNHKHPFDIEYMAERNRQYMKGAPGDNNVTFGGVLKSPFFPAYYPRDLGVEYVISCVKSLSHCRIKLIFTDFLISPQSVMEFYDWTGHKLRLTNGIKPRPPVILSSGPSLMIRFIANGGFGLGYKATYYFITGEPDTAALIPLIHCLQMCLTPHMEEKSGENHIYFPNVVYVVARVLGLSLDCGGEVENTGGAITMMNMVRGPKFKYYDCVWLIKPISNYVSQEFLLYMAIITFSNMGINSEINVYEGQTSEGNLLDIIKPFSVIPKPQYVVSVHSGFYISLKATFKNTSSLAIGYSVFSNFECIGETEYLCRNHRCINKQLYCDGFDHCGDNSDEPDTCSREWKFEPIDRRWYTHTPNYYFPKADTYLDMKTATMIFILGSVGLVILLGTLVFLVYRMGLRTRQQRELQNRLQTITDLFEGAHVSDVDVNDDPPTYEPPPSYDEVMKKEKEKMLRNCEEFMCATTVRLPDSPPPPYRDGSKSEVDGFGKWALFSDNMDGAGPSSDPSQPLTPVAYQELVAPQKPDSQPVPPPGRIIFNLRSFLGLRLDCECAGACSCAVVRRGSFAATWSPSTTRLSAVEGLLHNMHTNRQGSADNKSRNVKGSISADNIFHTEDS